MTLAELIPSLRSSLPHPLEPWLWPRTTRNAPRGDLMIGGVSLVGVARHFGTACQVIDVADFQARSAEFGRVFGSSHVSYAAKAFLTPAVCRWIAQAGLGLDVCSAGEYAIARSAGFPIDRITLHGNGKDTDLLRSAMPAGLGRIVLDSLDEIELLSSLALGRRQQPVLLRVIPEVDAATHPALTTGVTGQKFGIPLAAVPEAVRRLQAQPGLKLIGLHCHLGSQLSSTEPYARAAEVMVRQLAQLRAEFDLALPVVVIGGGFGIAYHGGDVPLNPGDCAAAARRAARHTCAEVGLPLPQLSVEPGRAIAGPAGVTVYQVLAVKTSGGRQWVTVDGGMADNPRPALYGARYGARLLGRLSGSADEHMVLAGQHCESGDVLINDALLPSDIHRGDLIAVPATGAYHHSMSSNYNATLRPPVIAVQNGRSRTLVRRETVADLQARDVCDW